MAGYLAYLALLFAVAGTVATGLYTVPVIEKTVDWAARSIPTLTLRDGRMTGVPPGPMRIEHPQFKRFAVVIDTTRLAPVTADDLERQQAVAFIAQNAFYFEARPHRVESEDFGLVRAKEPIVIDAELIRSFGRGLIKGLYPTAFLLFWLALFTRKLLASAAYYMVAALLNSGLDYGLPPSDLWRMAVVAQAPAVALEVARMFFARPIPYFGAIELVVVLAYLWQALKQSRREPPPAEA